MGNLRRIKKSMLKASGEKTKKPIYHFPKGKDKKPVLIGMKSLLGKLGFKQVNTKALKEARAKQKKEIEDAIKVANQELPQSQEA
jgi:hypothetical protein